ncbi:polyhydroxyalkanoate synthesis regulator DNA-binding domain-containing protein [Balneolaceae bacterium ANBcel3]|nr:polyhydroxyalkanoate synthesis regulator DNA-binding domain-containing protein [Balneolaceae bacterium ANBcel3]
MSERIIRRYANRKMYDVEKSTYVSMSDIAEMICNGDTVKITDKEGKEDYTARILQQIILEQNKSTDQSTVSQLHEWIRMGGSLIDRQLSGISQGMEKWFKERSSRFFKGSGKEEFESLKEKVLLLESRIKSIEEKKKK